jgi:hypothetical protein
MLYICRKVKQESTFPSSTIKIIHFALFNFRENSPDVIPHFVTPPHLTRTTVSFKISYKLLKGQSCDSLIHCVFPSPCSFPGFGKVTVCNAEAEFLDVIGTKKVPRVSSLLFTVTSTDFTPPPPSQKK